MRTVSASWRGQMRTLSVRALSGRPGAHHNPRIDPAKIMGELSVMTFASPLLRHHSVLIVDIAGFGRCSRRAQWVSRRAMTSVVQETLRRIGVDWRPGDGDELGDGLRVLLPAGMPKTLL